MTGREMMTCKRITWYAMRKDFFHTLDDIEKGMDPLALIC